MIGEMVYVSVWSEFLCSRINHVIGVAHLCVPRRVLGYVYIGTRLQSGILKMIADDENKDESPYFPKFGLLECVLCRNECNPNKYVLLDFYGDMLTCHFFCLSRAFAVALRACIPNAPPITLNVGQSGSDMVRWL